MTDDDLAGLFDLPGLSAPATSGKSAVVTVDKRRGMTAREVRDLFAANGLPAPSRREVAAVMKATALAAAAPAKRRVARPVPARPAHRPISGFSRTLDAACLYRELRRRGLKDREASSAVHTLMGTARSQILKYQRHPIEHAAGPLAKTRAGSYEPVNGSVLARSDVLTGETVDHDHLGAVFVVALYWRNMIRHRWRQLEPKARDALMPIVQGRLLVDHPPT